MPTKKALLAAEADAEALAKALEEIRDSHVRGMIHSNSMDGVGNDAVPPARVVWTIGTVCYRCGVKHPCPTHKMADAALTAYLAGKEKT